MRNYYVIVLEEDGSDKVLAQATDLTYNLALTVYGHYITTMPKGSMVHLTAGCAMTDEAWYDKGQRRSRVNTPRGLYPPRGGYVFCMGKFAWQGEGQGGSSMVPGIACYLLSAGCPRVDRW